MQDWLPPWGGVHRATCSQDTGQGAIKNISRGASTALFRRPVTCRGRQHRALEMKTLFLGVTLGLAAALSFTLEEEDEGGSVHPEENPDAENGGAWQIQRLWGQEAHVPAGAAREGPLRLLLQRPAPWGPAPHGKACGAVPLSPPWLTWPPHLHVGILIPTGRPWKNLRNWCSARHSRRRTFSRPCRRIRTLKSRRWRPPAQVLQPVRNPGRVWVPESRQGLGDTSFVADDPRTPE
ncbi:odorant-binding protein 2b isoform X8 [Pan paniscus]